MKRHIVTLCALISLGVTAPTSADHRHRGGEAHEIQEVVAVSRHHDSDWVRGRGEFHRYLDRRQVHQRERIRRGWRSGQLTHKELERLKREQGRIARLERRLNEDGHYSRKERRALRGQLDGASEHIYRKRHNGRNRYVEGHGDEGHRGAHRDRREVITFIDSPSRYDDVQGPACRDPRYR